MRLLRVVYEFRYEGDEEWFSDEQYIVAGEDSQAALDYVQQQVREHVVPADEPGVGPLKVDAYRLISAQMVQPQVHLLAPDVLLEQAHRMALIEFDEDASSPEHADMPDTDETAA